MSNDGDRSAPAPLASAIDAASSGAGGDAGATGRGGAADALAAQGTTAPAPADELMAKAERSTAPETPTGSNSDAGTGSEGADKKWFEVIPVVLEKVRERGNEAPSRTSRTRSIAVAFFTRESLGGMSYGWGLTVVYVVGFVS